MKTIGIFILCFSAQLLNAQSVREELEKINQQLLESSEISFKLRYTVYEDSLAKKPKEETITQYARKGLYSFYSGAGITVVQQPDRKLTVDEDGEILLLEPLTDSTARQIELAYPLAVDQALRTSTTTLLKKGNLKGIKLYYPGNALQQPNTVVIWYKSNYAMVKCILYMGEPMEFQDGSWSENPRLEMTYEKFSHKVGNTVNFSMAPYLNNSQSDTPKPLARYAHYEFMNLLNTRTHE